MRLRAERARASRAVAIASALLQVVAGAQLTVSLAWFGVLFSLHAHEHVLNSVRDGNHVDIVLSHEARRDTHGRGSTMHLHGSPADDHVVHLASDEARDTRRTHATALPTSLSSATPIITAPRVAAALSPPIARPVPPLSRRSVVLRT